MFWFGSIVSVLRNLFVWWNRCSCCWKLPQVWKPKNAAVWFVLLQKFLLSFVIWNLHESILIIPSLSSCIHVWLGIDQKVAWILLAESCLGLWQLLFCFVCTRVFQSLHDLSFSLYDWNDECCCWFGFRLKLWCLFEKFFSSKWCFEVEIHLRKWKLPDCFTCWNIVAEIFYVACMDNCYKLLFNPPKFPFVSLWPK
mgnify:CR=1 FL=1